MMLCLKHVKGNFVYKVRRRSVPDIEYIIPYLRPLLLKLLKFGVRDLGGRQQSLTLLKTELLSLLLEYPCQCLASFVITSTGQPLLLKYQAARRCK